jgi:hypothetical protein
MFDFGFTLLLIVFFAAISQFYFAERYRDIFEINSKKINKSYFLMIRELNEKHPAAGKIYIFLMIVQFFCFLLFVINEKF